MTLFTPVLKMRLPIRLIPVAGEFAVVAPVMLHVSFCTPQLSEYTGSGIVRFALHNPAPTLLLILDGHVMEGNTASGKTPIVSEFEFIIDTGLQPKISGVRVQVIKSEFTRDVFE